jgi:hypothetical protein
MAAGQRCAECRELGHNIARCPLAANRARPRRKVRLVVLSVEAERRSRGVSVEAWIAAPPPPLTREECISAERPCPALRCRHHNGRTCALDLAELGGMTLGEIALELNVTRERVRQIEGAALRKLRIVV